VASKRRGDLILRWARRDLAVEWSFNRSCAVIRNQPAEQSRPEAASGLGWGESDSARNRPV